MGQKASKNCISYTYRETGGGWDGFGGRRTKNEKHEGKGSKKIFG